MKLEEFVKQVEKKMDMKMVDMNEYEIGKLQWDKITSYDPRYQISFVDVIKKMQKFRDEHFDIVANWQREDNEKLGWGCLIGDNKGEVLNKMEINVVGMCPDCGDELIVRVNSRKGNKFLGCRGFPDCRYTEIYRGE